MINHIFEIGVTHISESDWDEEGRLITFTAPESVKNEDIAEYLLEHVPMIDLLFTKSGNADTIIQHRLGSIYKLRFSRITKG